MQNFNGDFDGQGGGNVTCEQTSKVGGAIRILSIHCTFCT